MNEDFLTEQVFFHTNLNLVTKEIGIEEYKRSHNCIILKWHLYINCHILPKLHLEFGGKLVFVYYWKKMQKCIMITMTKNNLKVDLTIEKAKK